MSGFAAAGGKARADPPGCINPEAVRVAEEALEQINQDRTNGYILSLNRLYDLNQTPEKEKGVSLYKLTIDVMETKWHITSRKPWKQWKSGILVMSLVCPDCPTADNLNEPVVKETANLSLQRFNEESSLANYFKLENITRASSQWVVGPAYFVEFTIVETVCSKTTDATELGHCPPMDCQFAHRGFCLGSHLDHEEQFEFRLSGGKKNSSFKNRKPVDVTCEIYEPQAAVVAEQAHAKSDGVHGGHQHDNHTHLHPHEHMHSITPSSDVTVSRPRGSLGTVVDQPAPIRSAPAASSCPGPHRHNLGLDRLKL
ncbi:hypothetical protein F7725_028038 [Dissostichus mawsoni]|uniref:Cystatin fetuin-B-type domain-containing protein n=1 Tax=Dissostichus mawsoni TaxID=36200 RepID=A0A7J5XEW1_DISMA|nr:hypothetical protein F7725_028038 [Dissostichus mawsoni]